MREGSFYRNGREGSRTQGALLLQGNPIWGRPVYSLPNDDWLIGVMDESRAYHARML
jgi:hypothetical protein